MADQVELTTYEYDEVIEKSKEYFNGDELAANMAAGSFGVTLRSLQKEEEDGLRNILSGLLALVWLVVVIPWSAQAGQGTVTYKPGALKAAVEKGETVLLIYRSTW